MTPPMYVQLDQLPMMPNRSKVDRSALSALYTKRTRQSKPTPLTQPLATLFDEALNLPLGTFKADSHFFEMGGHSLGVAHLVLALRTNYGIRVPARRFTLSVAVLVWAEPSIDSTREARLSGVGY